MEFGDDFRDEFPGAFHQFAADPILERLAPIQFGIVEPDVQSHRLVQTEHLQPVGFVLQLRFQDSVRPFGTDFDVDFPCPILKLPFERVVGTGRGRNEVELRGVRVHFGDRLQQRALDPEVFHGEPEQARIGPGRVAPVGYMPEDGLPAAARKLRGLHRRGQSLVGLVVVRGRREFGHFVVDHEELRVGLFGGIECGDPDGPEPQIELFELFEVFVSSGAGPREDPFFLLTVVVDAPQLPPTLFEGLFLLGELREHSDAFGAGRTGLVRAFFVLRALFPDRVRRAAVQQDEQQTHEQRDCSEEDPKVVLFEQVRFHGVDPYASGVCWEIRVGVILRESSSRFRSDSAPARSCTR